MNIEKRGNSYRVRKQYNGVSYSLSFDHKPTKKEVDAELHNRVGKPQNNGSFCFREASEEYINAKKNVLSPTTIREYYGTIRQLSPMLMNKDINKITQLDVQKEINRLSETRAPKTVRNYHAFIASVLGLFRPDLQLHTQLPMKIKKEPYIPSNDDIKALFELAKNSKMEVPLHLACYGMRRSEICALTMDDIDGNVITISKAKVMDANKEWVIKSTKTSASTRQIVVSDNVINLINEKGLYDGNPNSITNWMKKSEKKLGIPEFSIHKLRHYFASEMHANGIPDADIMKFGGWETDAVMKTVYRHSIRNDASELAKIISDSVE